MAKRSTGDDRASPREAVALFRNRDELRDAARRLLAAGFAPADLSVLTDHESLEIAGPVPGYEGTPGEALLAGLADESPLLVPVTIAGFAFLSGGPVAAAVAGLVTAGIGAAAIEEVVERLVANRHAAGFARELRAGAVALWVRTPSAERETAALAALKAAGGRSAHLNARPAQVKAG